MESLPFLLSINSHVRTSHRSCRPRHCAIYSYTVFFVRQPTSAAIEAQSSPLCFSTASFSALSSSFVHVPACAVVSSFLQTKARCHLCINCWFVRPGSSAAVATHFLPLCFSTISFSSTSSSFVHLPLRAAVAWLLGSKAQYHLPLHWLFVRPGTSAAIAAQFLPLYMSTASFSVLSSSFVHLTKCAIVSLFLESKALCHLLAHWFFVQLPPNSCHYASQLHPFASAAIAIQSVLYTPPYFFLQATFTAEVSFVSSSGVHRR
jgi:hypothetical protein